MTVNYELTKLYHRGKLIIVAADSLKELNTGQRDTLDHIVEFEHRKAIVTAKPRIPNYRHYKIYSPYWIYLPSG